MARATLVLDADVSALRRAMGEIPGITQRVQAVMTSQARRGGRERVAVDDGFADWEGPCDANDYVGIYTKVAKYLCGGAAPTDAGGGG